MAGVSGHTHALLRSGAFQSAEDALEFIGNVLEASTHYSMIVTDRDGLIELWNEGAHRLYGYEPDEIVGRSKSILHTPEDIEAGLPGEMMKVALEHGKWEGTVERVRKDGLRFVARVVVTPRGGPGGVPAGFLLVSSDISDEIRLTRELEETQFYTRSLIESNIDALMTTDPLGVITDVNEQMEALTGHTREELIGSPFKEYFTEPERAEDGIRLTLAEGKVTNYELTARAEDGAETVVSYNASTFKDGQGRLQGVFAAARDVTEHKQLEEQLRESESYNRGLIEASVDGLVTVAPDGLITDVNDRFCEMSDYPRAQLIGTPFSDYFTDPAEASAGVQATFSRSVVTDYVLTLKPREGELLQVSFNASVFKDDDGEVRGIFASARDITDQSRLQAQLADERTYNRGLIEASLDGLITVDPLLVITDVNERMCEMAGYTREELIGTDFPDYFIDSNAATDGVLKAFAEGSVTNYELTLRSKNGEERLVSFNAAIFADRAQGARMIFASARDIADQARLQRQLTEERAYNRGLIEASVDGLVTVDRDQVVTDVNATMCRMVGRQRSQLIGTGFPDYFVEAQGARAVVEQTFDKGTVIDYVLTLKTMEGRQVPVSLNAGVFRDAAGDPIGILAAARDITAQKELEQRLIDTQFYTRSLIESNIDALMTTDPLGVITDVNEQMETLTGHTREELIGSPFKDYFTEPERAEDGIRLTLAEGKATNYELTARARDGTETTVSYNASTFKDGDGRLQGVFAAARDVTERKELEALQDTNLELAQANQAKNSFLASMSHELRTPLNAILGFTGTVLMELPGPLTDEQRTQLMRVRSNGEHLLSIINDLLDLAKIESGKVELRLEPVACRSLAREVVSSLQPLAEEKGLTLYLREDGAEEEIEVQSDHRALSQILLNMTNNAIKFTETGEVSLEVDRVSSGGRDVTCFSVHDTGIGIKPEDQERLFEAFEQVSGLGGRPHEGTGLGLYISQKLAQLLHGRIAFESEEGVGSTFRFEVRG